MHHNHHDGGGWDPGSVPGPWHGGDCGDGGSSHHHGDWLQDMAAWSIITHSGGHGNGPWPGPWMYRGGGGGGGGGEGCLGIIIIVAIVVAWMECAPANTHRNEQATQPEQTTSHVVQASTAKGSVPQVRSAPGLDAESQGLPAAVPRGYNASLIVEVQRALAAKGYDPGPVDGILGPRTDAAVRAFQEAEGLDVDGLPGPRTRGALFPGRTGASSLGNATGTTGAAGVPASPPGPIRDGSPVVEDLDPDMGGRSRGCGVRCGRVRSAAR